MGNCNMYNPTQPLDFTTNPATLEQYLSYETNYETNKKPNQSRNDAKVVVKGKDTLQEWIEADHKVESEQATKASVFGEQLRLF